METQHKYGQTGIIGIRKEDKSKWERRTAITPMHVNQLLHEYPDLKFIVQPSNNRIFKDIEYVKAGAIISDDLSQCCVIFGIKEIPIEALMPNRTYVFFSHTIKGQEHNMQMLDHIIKNNIRLIDYEKITDNSNNRLVAFGQFAGNAGTIDFLSEMGRYFLNMGYSTPFLNISQSYFYKNLEKAKENLYAIGKDIVTDGIPQNYLPLIFAITGTGRCATGVMEILEQLPTQYIDADEIAYLVKDKHNPKHKHVIYVTVINAQHMVAPIESTINRPIASSLDKPIDVNKVFNKNEYYKHPELYKPIFHEKYLPYISVIYHCAYWEKKFHRLITTEQIKELAINNNLRLFGICDISCDLNGSIEILKEYTTIDNPTFLYNPISQEYSNDVTTITKTNPNIIYQAIDHLPTELPHDSSVYFAEQLYPYINNLAVNNINEDGKFEDKLLSEPIKKAIIVTNGNLTEQFAYINNIRFC